MSLILNRTGLKPRQQLLLARHAPEVESAIQSEMTASPRTFARFTGRPEGLVGGVPRATSGSALITSASNVVMLIRSIRSCATISLRSQTQPVPIARCTR